jgi:hypothetical protein
MVSQSPARRHVRYAVVGQGFMAQAAVLPRLVHAAPPRG